MIPNQKEASPSEMILLVFILINAVILEHAFTKNESWYWALIITSPAFIAAFVYHKRMKKTNNKGL